MNEPKEPIAVSRAKMIETLKHFEERFSEHRFGFACVPDMPIEGPHGVGFFVELTHATTQNLTAVAYISDCHYTDIVRFVLNKALVDLLTKPGALWTLMQGIEYGPEPARPSLEKVEAALADVVPLREPDTEGGDA